jgi:hypothetical protein
MRVPLSACRNGINPIVHHPTTLAGARTTHRQITAIMAGTLRHAATRQRRTPTLHRTAREAVEVITVAVEAVLRTAAVVVAAGTPEAAEAAILAAVAITDRS